MTWTSPAEFFAMGGYALYVWGAYGVTAACLLADPLFAASRHRRALQQAVRSRHEDADSADREVAA